MATLTLQQLAERVGAEIRGGGRDVGSRPVTGCASIEAAGADDVTFVANPKYARHLETTSAAGVFVSPDQPRPDTVAALITDDPYFAFRNAIVEIVGFRTHPRPAGDSSISPQASIDPTAQVAADAVVHPFAVIAAGATVGRGTILYPGVYIGENAAVGADCILYPNVTVYDRCILGDRVILHSSTVIGQDGFGHATHQGIHHKIPQTGIVVIEDDVELGAGCAIERAAMGETRIGTGTKFADLISIGHGTKIGRGCLFVSLCGVSGSVDVGDYVVLGGQVGVTGHITIGDGVMAMARTAIPYDIEPGRRIGGVPAIDAGLAKRNAMAGLTLADLARRVKALEKQQRNEKPTT